MRCLLLTAAWQAPLPFLHHHGTLANAAVETAPWLANHLRTHHPAIDLSSQVTFGWHCHFADPQSGDGSPAAPKPSRRPVAVASGLDAWDGFSRLQATLGPHASDDQPLVPGPSSTACMRAVLRRHGGFFVDFAPDMPLPARLGVLRC